jgi:hypothetical protein
MRYKVQNFITYNLTAHNKQCLYLTSQGKM